ncbi:MAG: hypothetical protein OXG68_09705 [Chloroflexi bacterium]|nr:hypothetical protein [Chloroflexota bacterium]
MNETQCIIEVRGYSKRTPITWREDPTRHLLKIKAVNAKDAATKILGCFKLMSHHETMPKVRLAENKQHIDYH